MTDERLRQIIAELQEWLEERRTAPPPPEWHYVPTIPWGAQTVSGCPACANGGVCGCVRPEDTPQCS